MTRVLGLDLSLTSTGIADVRFVEDLGTVAAVETIGSDATTADPLDRLTRFRRLASRINLGNTFSPTTMTGVITTVPRVDLAVVEGPSFSSKGSGTWDRAGFWWEVVRMITYLGIPLVEVPPSTVKKFATNNGAAKKAAVIAAMTRLWPSVELADDNQADALALAHIGARRLGLDVPSRAHHEAALAKVAWPDNLPEAAR